MSYEFAEKDLAHIRSVLNHLGHSSCNVRTCDAGAVMGLHYWRARVQAVLDMPLLPIHIERLAMDLLGRLDQLEDLRRSIDTA